jgi:hypothetical protein
MQMLAAVGGRDSLRAARLHAAEAVRLTARTQAWPLAVLADAAYLHWGEGGMASVMPSGFGVSGRM